MLTNKKILPTLILPALLIGCAENPAYIQKPAPVIRNHARMHRNDVSKSVQTYGYPESEADQAHSPLQEVPPKSAPVIESSKPASVPGPAMSSAVLALVSEADQNTQSGQYETAAVKIERALRIDSRNATLTYKLATIRLKQEQPRLAEDLAKKAALLAGGDHALKKQIWLLIAESKRMQNDFDGANKAAQKAAEF